ncbi:helix-turn-helix domain-containing protein [Saccharothrix australiensis]
MSAHRFEPLWSVAEVSAFLGVPVHTLYAWRAKHYGPPARRVGKHLRYLPSDVRAWFERLEPEVA